MLHGIALGQALKLAIQKKGVSDADVARAFGVKPPSVNDWKSFGRVHKKHTQKLVEYFSDVVGPEHWGLEIHATTSPLIPQYNVAGAMGNGGLVLDEQPPGIIKSWQVDEQWLRMNVPANTGHHNLCIVTGFGSSMQPMFNPGDPLLMDKGAVDCRSDGVYFFRIGENGYIKQLQRIPTANGLVIRAKSMNPNYDPFDITDGMDFHVLGKILLTWRSDRV